MTNRSKRPLHFAGRFIDIMRVLVVAGACLILSGALTLSYLHTDHEKEIMDALYLECTLDGQPIKFGLWEEEAQGRYYLFLPGCFKDRDHEFIIRYDNQALSRSADWLIGTKFLKIDGIPYRSGDTWKAPKGEEPLRLELSGAFGTSYMDKTLQVLVSENLPAAMIGTEDEKDLLSLKEFDNRKYIETGTLLLVDENGSIACNEPLERFKVRGNLTAGLDKKPFTFSFGRPVSLCGMEPALKWNLLANATDGSYLRNKVVLDLANQGSSSYEPEGVFTELYLNGRYQGLYLLTEAVEIAENRLEISPEESWFLEMELDFRMEEDTPYLITDRGQIFAVNSPAIVTEPETEKIRFMLNDIESALFSEDGISALSHKPLEELLDFDSWAFAWLIQEISGDHDTGIASQFAYTDSQKAGPLYAGPVWDFDGTMGNVNTPMFTNPSALTTSIENTREEGNANQNRWLAAMYKNPAFRKTLEEKYRTVFRPHLEEMLKRRIDGYAGLIGRSAALDAFRWNDKRLTWMFALPEGLTLPDKEEDASLGRLWDPDYYTRFAALESHIAMVRDFLREKMDLLDRLWIEHREFCVVEVQNNAPFLNQDYNQTLYYWVEKGTPVDNLPHMEEGGYRFKGYVDRESREIVTNQTIITRDCTLEGIWEPAE